MDIWSLLETTKIIWSVVYEVYRAKEQSFFLGRIERVQKGADGQGLKYRFETEQNHPTHRAKLPSRVGSISSN